MIDWAKHWAQNRDNIRILCEIFDAKKTFKLLEGNCDGSSTHKTNNGSMG